MNEKSHVSMERRVCAVCTKEYDTNCVLLDRRFKKSMDRYTVTGFGLCPEHQKMFDDGFVALVAIDESKSDGHKADEVWRTGQIAHVRRSAVPDLFNVPIPADTPLVWVEPEVIDLLKSRTTEH
jgi:hypothetical protein